MQSSRQTLLIFMYVNSICPCGKALVSLFGMCDRILLFFFRLFDLGNFFFSLPALWGLVSECSGQSAVGWLLHQHCSNAHSICMSHHSTPLTSSFPSLPLPTHTLFFSPSISVWFLSGKVEFFLSVVNCKFQVEKLQLSCDLFRPGRMDSTKYNQTLLKISTAPLSSRSWFWTPGSLKN